MFAHGFYFLEEWGGGYKKKKKLLPPFEIPKFHRPGFGASLGKADLAIVAPCLEHLDWHWSAGCLLGGVWAFCPTDPKG